ncbi:MAG TPA: cyclic nucleotide-binding domain-containing protein [Nannocystaceae bacterium]|nr:cyclic nucleotide-binding domain-containing protein [Nannocystaceae bacterium]
MDVLVHVANLLFLGSYSVRDVLWLRLLAVVAFTMLLPYNYYVPNGPLWAPMGWNVLFLAINLAQAWRLVLERRPVRLSFEQQRLHQALFSALRPRQFLALLAAARLDAHARDQIIVEAGRPLERLSLVADGSVRVEVDGTEVAQLGEGRFVGEMSYLTGDPPRASVVAAVTCRCVHWPVAALRSFLDANPEIRAVMQNLLGADLARKLRSA